MAKVVDHVRAVLGLLKAVHGTPSYARTLEVQSRSIGAAIDNSCFTVTEAAAVAEELKGFPDAEKGLLTAKLTERVGAHQLHSKATRNALQDYCYLQHYCTEATWAVLQGDEATHVKLDALLQAAIMVGMRCPSETSVQLIAAVHLITAEGKAKALQMSPAMKLELARNVKSRFRSTLARMQQSLPLTYVARLPLATATFKDEYPEWWEVAFADSPPIPSPIAAEQLHQMMGSIPMQGSRGDSGKTSSGSSSSSAGGSADQAMQVMMEFAKAFLPRMQQEPTLNSGAASDIFKSFSEAVSQQAGFARCAGDGRPRVSA